MPAAPSAGGDVEMESVTSEGQMGGGGAPAAAGDASSDAGSPAGPPAPNASASSSDDLILRAGGAQSRVPAALARRLTPLQIEGVRWLYRVYHGDLRPTIRGGILGDGTGLGKTVQSIALLTALIGSKQAALPEPPLPEAIACGDGARAVAAPRAGANGGAGERGRGWGEGWRGDTYLSPCLFPDSSAPGAPRQARRVLVVVPKACVFNWRREFCNGSCVFSKRGFFRACFTPKTQTQCLGPATADSKS